MIIWTLFHVLNNLIMIKKTTGIWCLQWCSIRAMQKTRDQNPTAGGRNKRAEMHQLLLWCKLSAESTYCPWGAQTAQRWNQKTAYGILYTIPARFSTWRKENKISERSLWLQVWEQTSQTPAVINIHLLCIQRGLCTYLTAFSRCARSALSFESLPFCFTLGKPSLKALTYFVSMSMSAFAGFSTALQINSCVTGIDLFMETHRSER